VSPSFRPVTKKGRLSPFEITRARVSLSAIVVACVLPVGVAYADGGPGAVYNDYAQDGVLSCNHSHADLVAVLRSGSLNQYGDPLTLARLKLAVRKQLAGGCRRHSGSRSGTAPTGRSGGGTSTVGQQPRPKPAPTQAPTQATPSRAASAKEDSGAFFAKRGVIVGLLVVALAFGGWLTKHALAARD